MANLNKVFLIGRLTFDPELRRTPSGTAVTELRMAINRVVPTREGETREETVFLDVTVWGRQAENCCQYLKKGRQVHVEGFLKMETWEDKTTGQQRSKVKVQADNIQFLDSQGGRRDDSPPPDEDAAPRAGGEQFRPAGGDIRSHGPANGSAGRPAGAGPTASRRAAEPEPEESGDDIPF